ncbi:MAG: mannose-1-phosphate guanylyltransferase [bacterium]|nr:mannose-1-phosphate guanylyltransferase [bacterium]
MQALILAGGSGTRFWPLSRKSRPKQLLALEGDRSLLQETVDRLAPLVEPAAVWVCTTRVLADAVREQLPEIPAGQILVEPVGRNTAPAIGWSLRSMPDEVRRGVVAVLPADHRFADASAFRTTLGRAAEAVERADLVMTLGVTPRWPETGYGYLELGEELDDLGAEPTGLRAVARFIEKPDAAAAERYVDDKNHLWNAGIFVFRGTTLLQHLTRFEPGIGRGLEAIATAPERTAEIYPDLRPISIDYAVMERLESIATLPLDCGWSDLGSWEALTEVLPAGDAGNRSRGDVLAIDAGDNLLYADRGTVAVLGVQDLVVVRTEDCVLVLPRERSQEVRRLVDLLERQNRADML